MAREQRTSLNPFERLSARVSRTVWNVVLGAGFAAVVVGVVWSLWAWAPRPAGQPDLESEDTGPITITLDDVQALVETDDAEDSTPGEVASKVTPPPDAEASGPPRLHVEFTRFRTEWNQDALFIYDGPTVKERPDRAHHGSSLPPAFTSSHPSGAITFRFVSDRTIEELGFRCVVETIGRRADRATSPAEDALLALLSDDDRAALQPELETRDWLVMKPGARRVDRVEFYDPNGNRDYNPNNDVVMTLWPADTRIAMLDAGLRRQQAHSTDERTHVLEAWTRFLGPYDVALRGALLRLVTSLDPTGFTPGVGVHPEIDATIGVALQGDDPTGRVSELGEMYAATRADEHPDLALLFRELVTAPKPVGFGSAAREIASYVPLEDKKAVVDAFLRFGPQVAVDDGDEILSLVAAAYGIEAFARDRANEGVRARNEEAVRQHDTERMLAEAGRIASRPTAAIVFAAGILAVALTTLLVIALGIHRALEGIRREITQAPPS